MFIENKEGLRGNGRIGLIHFSKTGKTLYYEKREFQSLKGLGYKSNYYDTETDIEYWIEIRKKPEMQSHTSYNCSGKYSRRKPHPELNVKGNSRNGGSRGKQRS